MKELMNNNNNNMLIVYYKSSHSVNLSTIGQLKGVSRSELLKKFV